MPNTDTFASCLVKSRGAGFLIATLIAPTAFANRVDHVLHISVDGLRPDAVTAQSPHTLPNFYRLRREGVFTDNARTVDSTSTLPNHVSQVTGRWIGGDGGHNYQFNSTPPPEVTIHSNKEAYVAGAFDLAHDYGLSTGLFASKPKFSLFEQSYNQANGAPDSNPAEGDNGRDKIDVYSNQASTSTLVTQFVSTMSSSPLNYSLLHLADPDNRGHGYSWDITPGSEYLDAVKVIDGYLGQVFNLIDTHQQLNGNTAVILTSDHGGRLGTQTHGPANDPENFTIPFYAWGPDVAAGVDLYELNSQTRGNPGADQPGADESGQPVRNADAANLALDLLGLDAIPGSTIGSLQDLSLNSAPVPLPPAWVAFVLALASLSIFSRRPADHLS